MMEPTMTETSTTETSQAPDKRWYVIHTYSGYENKVKANLEHRIELMKYCPHERRHTLHREAK